MSSLTTRDWFDSANPNWVCGGNSTDRPKAKQVKAIKAVPAWSDADGFAFPTNSGKCDSDKPVVILPADKASLVTIRKQIVAALGFKLSTSDAVLAKGIMESLGIK